MQDETYLGHPLVVLMRHAEAGEATKGGSDFERTLTRKGEADAEAVARRLAEAGWMPARALCSAAWRTRQTFSVASKVWGGAIEVEYRDDLYLAEPGLIAGAVQKTLMANLPNGDALPPALLLVGHNPGIEALASQWAGKVVPMPTAAAAIFSFGDGTAANAAGGEDEVRVRDRIDFGTLQMIDRVVP